MDLRKQLRDLEVIRAEINYLLTAPDMAEATREELRARLDEVSRLRDRWEVLRAKYQRAKSREVA